MTSERFRFLFRQDAGVVDAPTWWRNALVLNAILALGTLGWVALSPHAHHDLAQTRLVDPLTLATYVYLFAYAFSILIVEVCQYFLSAKRLRDRGLAPSLAGLWPVGVLLATSLHWLVPRSEGQVPMWTAWALDVVVVVVLLWLLVQLGSPGRRA